MKGLFILLILAGLVYGGSIFLRQKKSNVLGDSTPTTSGPTLILSQASDKLGDIAASLTANIGTALENGEGYLSDVTNGASEPIINQLLQKTQETLKDLPKKEAEKIKYEFCKGVISEYETAKKESQ